MESLIEALPFLAAPFVACLVIAGLHCYMGLHVIKRGVIFVDLALAQAAALGAALSLVVAPMIGPAPHHADHAQREVISEDQLADLLGQEDAETGATEQNQAVAAALAEDVSDHAEHEHGSGWLTYGMSLGFALLGAVVMSFVRPRSRRVPHEAVIGIIFVVCAALSVLVLSKAPHGHERMQAMLVGSVLFVRWTQVGVMAAVYAGLGIVHFALRRHFLEITEGVDEAEQTGKRVRLWDCVFYATFALMVTQSVSIAGVLVVFSYLIIPGVCAALFAARFGAQLVLAWIVAVLTTVLGLALSAVGDMPTGPSLVSCFGGMLVLFALVRWWVPTKGETA